MKENLFKKGLAKRLFSVILTLAMVIALMPLNSITAYADTDWVKYEDKGITVWYKTGSAVFAEDEIATLIMCTEYPPCGEGMFRWENGNWQAQNTCPHVVTTDPTGGSTHTHSWSYTFDNNQHWQKCASCTETQGQADHSWVKSADGSTTKCETCGAYVTVSAESGVTPKTVKDCVKITTNLPTTPTIAVMDTSATPAKEVALSTSIEGNYQAVAQVKSGVNPYADFTLTNPKTTATTGDNRPIELIVFGFAAMSVMAAAAFTMDRKRR